MISSMDEPRIVTAARAVTDAVADWKKSDLSWRTAVAVEDAMDELREALYEIDTAAVLMAELNTLPRSSRRSV